MFLFVLLVRVWSEVIACFSSCLTCQIMNFGQTQTNLY